MPGYLPHVQVIPPNAAYVRYRTAIFVRVSRTGWLTASWLVAVVIGGVMIAGRFNLDALYGKHTSGEAGTAATLLLALLGVFATMLVGPMAHPLASRLLLLARLLIGVDVIVILVGVGDLVLHQAGHPTPASVSGRGLAIVAHICQTWGVRTDDVGLTVWAILPAPGSSQATMDQPIETAIGRGRTPPVQAVAGMNAASS